MSYSGDSLIIKDKTTETSIEFVSVKEEIEWNDVKFTEAETFETSIFTVKDEVESSDLVDESVTVVKHDIDIYSLKSNKVMEPEKTVLHLGKKSETGLYGERLHPCETCQRKFLWPSHLIEHLKTHFGTKDFECDQCQKRFLLKKTLHVHKKIHSGVKDFECEHCKKRFLLKNHLNRHLKIHSGVKDFECKHCKKRFLRTECLRKHLKRHLA